MKEARTRTLNLLADQAASDLSHEDGVALAALLTRFPEYDDDSMDLAAAAMDLAMTQSPTDNLPQSLQSKIERDARLFFKTLAEVDEETPEIAEIKPFKQDREVTRSKLNWLPWAAAAVFLTAALLGWLREPTTPNSPQPPVSLAQQWTSLSQVADATQLAMTGTEDEAAAGAAGSLIWSPTQQQGFMRINGLQSNDPNMNQYQLWIFDKDQDERYPIDGGVFNIPPGETEAIIPIHAKITAMNPTLYAITVEKPGGVVVSSRERIVMIAQPAG